MGLSICYDLSLPAETPAAKVHELLAGLRKEALGLPFEETSELVQFNAADLSGPWPTKGLVFSRLEDVVDVCGRSSREILYRKHLGLTDDDEYVRTDVRSDLPTVVLGFAVAPGKG